MSEVYVNFLPEYTSGAIYDNAPGSSFSLGEVYLAKSDTSKALQHFVESIKLHPKIIDSKDFAAIVSTDSILYNNLKIILLDSNQNLQTPQDMGRLGFILDRFGQKEKSESVLTTALRQMPSLSTLWLLLGDTTKYNLLSRGAFQGETHKITIPTDKFSVYAMFCKTYIDKQ